MTIFIESGIRGGISQYPNGHDKGHIFKVDLEYPKELSETHKDFVVFSIYDTTHFTFKKQ